jgi:hypothetical protein
LSALCSFIEADVHMFLGYPEPAEEKYDVIETKKHISEVVAFVLGAVAVFVF